MVFCDKIGIISTLDVFIFERQVVIMIDIKASEEIIDYCMSKGINYYDTAWGYHSGNSELVVGDLRRTASQVQDAQISCCSLIMSLN